MKKFIKENKEDISQFIATGYFLTVSIVNPLQYDSFNKVLSSQFFLTVQQLWALTAWNLYKSWHRLKYRDSERNFPQSEALRRVGGVVHAFSWEVTLLWVGLLHNGLPRSILFHVTPTFVSTVTSPKEIEIKSRADYGSRVALMVLWNTISGSLPIAFALGGLENPDNGKHSVYPGYTDWDTDPTTAVVILLAVVIGASPLMPGVAPLLTKLLKWIRNTCCGCFKTDEAQGWLLEGKVEDNTPPLEDDGDSPASAGPRNTISLVIHGVFTTCRQGLTRLSEMASSFYFRPPSV